MKFKLNYSEKANNDIFSEENDIQQFDHQEVSIVDLLVWATTSGCSDLYIKEFDYPYVSRFGKIVKIPCVPISRDAWMEFQDAYINNQMVDTYMVTRMLDTATEVRIPQDNPYYGVNDEYFFRYRSSFGFSDGSRIGTFRMIRPEQPSFATINYPEQCKVALQEAFSHRTGIIVFTGATGSGKTTTQVAVMNDFTRPGQVLDNKVIIGLEDPIEYTFKSTESVKFNQKELEKDFTSYELGIKQALREHPNIILIGECRDKPVINATIEAARTGHLVSTSFHASNVGGTIARLSFHLDNDINLIYDLIINLRIIMSQTLVPSDTGYLVDTQYMIFNDNITRRILEIVQKNENISLEIEKMFKEQNLIDQGLVKDWDYKHLQ